MLRLADGVGARGQRVLLGVAGYLRLGRHDGRRVGVGGRGSLLLLLLLRPRLLLLLWLLPWAAGGLEGAGDGRGAILAVLRGSMVDVDIGRRSIIVGRAVQVLLLGLRRRRRGHLAASRRYVQLLVGASPYCRRPVSRGVEARVGGGRCGRGQVAVALRLGVRAALGQEGIGAGARGALGCPSQIASRRSYAYNCEIHISPRSRRCPRPYILPNADAAAKMPCAGSLCAFWWWFPKGMAPAIALRWLGRRKERLGTVAARIRSSRAQLRLASTCWAAAAVSRQKFPTTPPPSLHVCFGLPSM